MPRGTSLPRWRRPQAAAEVAHANTLRDQLRDLHGRSLAALDRAGEAADLRVGTLLLREARGCITLLARMTGGLVPRPDPPETFVLNSPEWIRVLSTIMYALDPFPEARLAVAEGLASLSGDAEATPGAAALPPGRSGAPGPRAGAQGARSFQILLLWGRGRRRPPTGPVLWSRAPHQARMGSFSRTKY
jgi:hypothetical protein